MSAKTFEIEKTQDEKPVYLIEIDGSCIDYEFSLEDFKNLSACLSRTIKAEENLS